jgi:transposase
VSNVLSEEKKQQVIALGRLGWSLRRIQQATRIRRETAAGYLKAAGIAIRAPGGWGRNPAKAAKPAIEVATDPAAERPPDLPRPEAEWQPGRSPTSSACEPYREVIELGLSRGRNAMAIWQDLVDDHGFTGRYNSVKRFVRKQRGVTSPEARVVIETAAGEEAQVDYGEGPMVRDPSTGKYRRMRMFVMTLGHSRKSVRLLVFRSSTQTWAELHEKAFRRLGGATRVVVLDNLKEGVLAPDLYDPSLNPLYRDVLKHYGAVALPCRVNDPDRKGKVESGVGHAQKTPLKGLRFETAEEAQAYLDRWEERWADTRIHGTTKRQVHLDGCGEIDAAYYGAPPGWIGRRVNVQWDDSHVRILDPLTGNLLREHLRQQRGRHRIKDEDRPSKTPLSTRLLLARCEKAGRHIGAFCQGLHRHHGEVAVRRILGVLSMAKKYGVASAEDACAVALETGATEYHFVRRYLERGPQLPLNLRQVDPLIRQLTLYRDLIESRIQQDPATLKEENHESD